MKQIRHFSSLVISLLYVGLIGQEDGDWIDLFNGKDLNDWQQKGGDATYEVVDGTILGTTVANSPNSFLCTEQIYADFILEYEMHVDTGLNSGVQIRSNSFPDYRNGRVHGYQVETDPLLAPSLVVFMMNLDGAGYIQFPEIRKDELRLRMVNGTIFG